MTAIICQQVVKAKPCGGTIDPDEGVCEKCGRPPVKTAGVKPKPAAGGDYATTTQARYGTGTQGQGSSGSGRVSRRQNVSTSRRQNELGGGLVSLPPVPSQDPLKQVMPSPEVPPLKRNCPSCGGRVTHMKGYCPHCTKPYDFRPGLKAGDILAGKYEIKGPIGLGGMGWIYLASDIVLKRWVVLKGVLNAKDADAAAAAVAERQFLAAVKHPNIVQIYDFAASGSTGYMVLEYVGGRTVDDIRADLDLCDLLAPEDGHVVKTGVLRKDIATDDKGLVVQITKFGVLPPEQALSYLMAICPAFGYLHGQGFTHNDMKPDNIMVEGDQVKLLDLGAMHKIGDADGLLFGTDGYCPPEGSTNPVAASDLYAIGRTLATLVMDFLYRFRADLDQTTKTVTTCRLIVKNFKAALPSPDDQPLLKRYDSLYRLLLRSTQENPDERFQTADEMQSQMFGLLREIMAEKTGPKPADSKVFFGDGLIDGADIAGISGPQGRLLPVLRLDASDKAASQILGLSALADASQRMDALKRLATKYPQSAEAKLRLADTLIDLGRFDDAVQTADKILADDEFEWRAHWYAGKALLSLACQWGRLSQKDRDAGVDIARRSLDRFDRTYFEMPGELAPRLAIAMASELVCNYKNAAAFYGLVAMIDPSYASAGFGLARCRKLLGDDVAAAAALSALPASHSMFTQSRFALARVLIGADAAKNPDFLGRASETLASVKTDSGTLHEISADLLTKAVSLIDLGKLREDGSKSLVGAPTKKKELRLAAAKEYAMAGRLAGSEAEKARFIDMSNAARPVTLF